MPEDAATLAAKQSIDEQLPASEFMGPFIDDMNSLDPLQVAAGDQAAEDQVDRDLPAVGAAPNDTLLLPPSRDPTAVDDTGDPFSDVLAAQTDAALSLPAELSGVGRTAVVRNRAGMGPNGSFPSDSTGSAGTRYYVEMVNDRIEVFRLSDLGHVAGPMTTQAFTRSPATSSVGDVQIEWDPFARRWFYLADRLPAGGPKKGSDYLAYGWSKTSSPRDLAKGWCHFFYRSPGSAYDDFPKLGHSDGAVIFGSDLQTPRNTLITPRIFIVTKPSASAASSCKTPRMRVFGSRKHPLMPAGTLAPIPVNLQQSSSLGYVAAPPRPRPSWNPVDAVDRERERFQWQPLRRLRPGGRLQAPGRRASAAYAPAARRPVWRADPGCRRSRPARRRACDLDPAHDRQGRWEAHPLAASLV